MGWQMGWVTESDYLDHAPRAQSVVLWDGLAAGLGHPEPDPTSAPDSDPEPTLTFAPDFDPALTFH
jgi:hypothetical protein